MAQKDLTQIFAGLFFFIALLYFSIMYYVLEDKKAYFINNVYGTNRFGEKVIVNKGEDVLDPINT